MERIKKKWLMDKNNHLEHDALVDIGAATKVSLKGVQLSEEKKNKFRGQCRTMVLDILVKLAEKTPLRYAVVRCASSLSPGNMIRVPQKCSQMFVVLADRLFAVKKISASVADNAKYQCDEFLKVAETQHKEEFLKFCFKVDRLDTFLGKFLAGDDSYKDVWTVCKTVFIFSHGQSFTERGFSVNKEVVDYNMEEKSLTSQRLVYDAIHDGNAKLTDFQITPALRKSCLLSHQQYEMELEKKAEEKQRSSADLKGKMKHDEISNVKKQRVKLEATIQSLTDGIIKEALLADDKKDLASTAKAAAFCCALNQKKETLAVLTKAQEKLEAEYKGLLKK